MSSIIEIEVTERTVLAPLFAKHRYDTVLIRCVLEAHFGVAYADSRRNPTVARLDCGAFTMLGGEPDAPDLIQLLRRATVHYVTPEDDAWRRVLRGEFGDRISCLSFTEFSWRSLDAKHLARLVRNLPEGFELKRVDARLAERLPSEMDNPFFLESFHSVEDFVRRGIGYCTLHQNRIVSAATSYASCQGAIDIDIKTLADHRQRGLGTVVGARLALHCVENGIEPHWLAENAISEKLALKLGYTRDDAYETFLIRH